MRDDAPEIVIVGAGMAGVSAAVHLAKAGIDDFVILEKAAGVGGTWFWNTYPGCRCDVTSPMYSFSFAPNAGWSQLYAGHAELRAYVEDVVDRFGLTERLFLRTEVLSYTYDDDVERWRVETTDGRVLHPRVVIAGTGAMHHPRTPEFDRVEEFEGRLVHSARWDPSLDLTGRRVAVIGTGSSAAQIVPAIAEHAEHVTVVQRTPQWVLPKPNRALRPFERWLFRVLPASQRPYRALAYWSHEAAIVTFLHPRLTPIMRRASLRHLRRQVPDPALRAALTPEYVIGCKRIVLASDFYPALMRENVELVASTVDRFDATGFRTADGRVHEADVVVLATGFEMDDRLAGEQIVGTGGLSIQDAWRDGMRAHLGVTIAGFPNFFLMMGPNTSGGSQSIVHVLESQAHYIAECVTMMRAEGADRLEVRQDVQDEFNERIHARLDRTVWNTGGCTSWFLDHAGVNRHAWPGLSSTYRRRTRRPRRDWFRLRRAPARTALVGQGRR